MKALITHVRSEVIGNHALISVWNRGTKAGMLVVSAEDGVSLCCRLVPRGNERTDAAGGYSRWALAEATVRFDGVTLTVWQDGEDATLARVEVAGELAESCSWDGQSLVGFPRFTNTQELQDRGHDAICQAYAEAMRLL